MNENLLKARAERIRKEKTNTILKLIVVLLFLLVLIPIQTIIWILRNPPEQPKWFSQTVIEEIEFTFGGN